MSKRFQTHNHSLIWRTPPSRFFRWVNKAVVRRHLIKARHHPGTAGWLCRRPLWRKRPLTTTASGPTAAPQIAPDTLQPDPNVARVMRGMHGVLNQNGGSVTLRLSPPEMGVVRIEMQINNGTVNAQLHTEHESARTLLNQQLGQLRHALESQGLSVERLNVQTISQDNNASFTSDRETGEAYEEGRSRGQYASTQDNENTADDEASQRGGAAGENAPSSFDQVLNTVA